MFAKLTHRFWRDERGSAAFEAIWVGLYLAFMVPPTMFLMEFSQTHMDGTWGQREAARFDAINAENALGSLTSIGGCSIPSVPYTIIEGTNATNHIVCWTTQIDEPTNNRFWKKMESASSSDFPTIINDMKDKGDFRMHYSLRYTYHSKQLELGDGSGGKNIKNGDGILGAIGDVSDGIQGIASSIGAIVDPPSAMAPSTEYYKGNEDHWKKGHDKQIWLDLSNKSRRLFPKVFPSRT